MIVRYLPLSLITLVLCDCGHVASSFASSSSKEVSVNSATDATKQNPALVSTMAMDASMLIGPRWVIFSASDSGGQPIAPLQPSLDYGALELTFTDQQIFVSGGCNRFSAPYRHEVKRLDIGELMQTTMNCANAELNAIDNAITRHLKGALTTSVVNDARVPNQKTVQLLAPDGTQLRLYAIVEPTLGDDYTTVLFEVAPQQEPCIQLLLPSLGWCLRVRELRYNESNVLEAEEGWWPYRYAIKGYRHIAGQRNVLRLKQFEIQTPPIHGAASILELDMVIASEMQKQ